MDYHLHQQGQTVGVFSLEELRRRRQAGELTGSELVWCEGMATWQSLDDVLSNQPPPIVPTAPPAAKQPSRIVPIIISVAVVLVGCLVVFGIVAVKVARQFQPMLDQAIRQSAWSDTEAAVALASRPIQWTTNALTMAGVRAQQKEFRVRQYVDGYENGNDHQSSCDAEVRQFITNWLDYYYGGNAQTNSTLIVEEADRLAANPACDDPLVWSVLGGNINEMHEQVRRFDRAVKGYEHSRYKAYPRFYATVMLANTLADLHRDPDRVRDLDQSAKRLLKQAFKDGSILPKDQQLMADTIMFGWGSAFVQRNGTTVPAIIADAGDPFHWMALVVEGEHQVDAAWAARGGEYADKVTPQGWKGFRMHLAKARENFTQAWQLRPDLVMAPNRMITVAMGNSGISEMRLWFDRATMAQLDWPGIWNQMRWGLRPRWGGSLEAMQGLGIAALNTRRFDTDVPRKYFDTVTDVEDELKLPTGQHIYGREDIWPHLQEMYEGYIAEPSEARNQVGWRTSYSIVAFLAGKLDVARTQLEAIQWNPWRGNLENWGRDLSLMPLEVAARTGSASQQVEAAESKAALGESGVAFRMYTDLSAATNLDEQTQSFIRERTTTLKMEQRIQSGDWVDFLPDSSALTGWTVERGKCSRTPDGALEVETGETGHIVFARARVGNDFEVKGRFEVVRSSNNSFQGGLVFGLPQFDSRTWYGFRIKRNPDEGDVVSFAEGWSTSQLVKALPLNNQTNSFYLSIHHGLVTARVNDQPVFDNAKPPDQMHFTRGDSYLGFGAYSDANDTVIRYRDVQVRKLPAR